MPETLNSLLDQVAKEALASGDQAILDLVEKLAELTDGGKTTILDAVRPNLVERLENLTCCLDEISNELEDDDDLHGPLENAAGITSEMLTMIDGR